MCVRGRKRESVRVLRKREQICVCVTEMESMCERQREHVCVWERICLCETDSMCVRLWGRESVCVREARKENAHICICQCFCVFWTFARNTSFVLCVSAKVLFILSNTHQILLFFLKGCLCFRLPSIDAFLWMYCVSKKVSGANCLYTGGLWFCAVLPKHATLFHKVVHRIAI